MHSFVIIRTNKSYFHGGRTLYLLFPLCLSEAFIFTWTTSSRHCFRAEFFSLEREARSNSISNVIFEYGKLFGESGSSHVCRAILYKSSSGKRCKIYRIRLWAKAIKQTRPTWKATESNRSARSGGAYRTLRIFIKSVSLLSNKTYNIHQPQNRQNLCNSCSRKSKACDTASRTTKWTPMAKSCIKTSESNFQKKTRTVSQTRRSCFNGGMHANKLKIIGSA